jgi:uncharacterized protein involved in tolerance to divalent cations
MSKKTQINSINLYMWLGDVTGEIESALVIGVSHTNVNQFDLYIMSSN